MTGRPERLPDLAASALVFVASGSVLVLELLGLRLLAPYVGLTLQTTTSIIGVVLGGIAAGAALGGRAADRGGGRRLIATLFAAGGLLAIAIVPVVRALGEGVRGGGDGGALLVTMVALLPAATVLSAIPPIVTRLQVDDLRLTGTVVGGLSAWGTGGALAGTFGTGFVLVPLLPTSTATTVTGAVLLALGIGLGARTLGVLAGAPVLLGAAALAGQPCDAETTYHCARLEADGSGGTTLVLDDLRHSYVDLREPRRLELPYTRWIADALPAGRLDAVFAGGGALALPRWLAATRPGSTSRVLEVDDRLVDLVAERLPYAAVRPAIRVRVGDARTSLGDEPDRSADVVVGDAFGGVTVPWQLTTVEWLDDVRRVLRPGGRYVMNLVDRGGLRLLAAQLATLRTRFDHVAVVGRPQAADRSRPLGGNLVLVASDAPLPPLRPALGATTFDAAALAAGGDVLRDDRAPAEQLVEPYAPVD